MSWPTNSVLSFLAGAYVMLFFWNLSIGRVAWAFVDLALVLIFLALMGVDDQ